MLIVPPDLILTKLLYAEYGKVFWDYFIRKIKVRKIIYDNYSKRIHYRNYLF